MERRRQLLQGTLDLLILQTVALVPIHGHGIAKHIQRTSKDVLQVEHGSLYPALQRLERQRLIASRWEKTAGGREMKLYRLTDAGRRHLAVEESNWRRIVRAMGLVLRPV